MASARAPDRAPDVASHRLKHHLNRYPVPKWVQQQVYLHPYPKEADAAESRVGRGLSGKAKTLLTSHNDTYIQAAELAPVDRDKPPQWLVS
jgi:hypothetical protein